MDPHQNSEEYVSLIFHYITQLVLQRSLEETLMVLANMGRDLIKAERCTLWLWDKEKGELWSKVAHGVDAIRIPENSGLVGLAIEQGKPLIINDPYNHPKFYKEVDQKTGFTTNSVLLVPIFNTQGEIIAAFQALNKDPNENGFTEDDVVSFQLAASYAGKSLENAMLSEEIDNTQREIIFLLGEIGESRSKETDVHVRRVAEYSRILAETLGLSPKEINLLYSASPMHDIGKVSVPDEILNKPGKLTDDEYAIIKMHTDIGYRLLKNSKRELLSAAAIIAHEHHEYYNGKGYPRGLAGDEIHIFGQITSVADVFDALSTERCYKKAWDMDRVRDLFINERGNQFRPEVVDALFQSWDKFLDFYKLTEK